MKVIIALCFGCLLLTGCDKYKNTDEETQIIVGPTHKCTLEQILCEDGVKRIGCSYCHRYVKGFVVSTPYEKCDSIILGEERADIFCKSFPSSYFSCDGMNLNLTHWHRIFINKKNVIFVDDMTPEFLEELEKEGYIEI